MDDEYYSDTFGDDIQDEEESEQEYVDYENDTLRPSESRDEDGPSEEPPKFENTEYIVMDETSYKPEYVQPTIPETLEYIKYATYNQINVKDQLRDSLDEPKYDTILEPASKGQWGGTKAIYGRFMAKDNVYNENEFLEGVKSSLSFNHLTKILTNSKEYENPKFTENFNRVIQKVSKNVNMIKTFNAENEEEAIYERQETLTQPSDLNDYGIRLTQERMNTVHPTLGRQTMNVRTFKIDRLSDFDLYQMNSSLKIDDTNTFQLESVGWDLNSTFATFSQTPDETEPILRGFKQTYNDYLKNKIDGFEKLEDKDRHITHKYEKMKEIAKPYINPKGTPQNEKEVVNRSYMKMWEVLKDYQLLKDFDKNPTAIFLAEGPGGFISAVRQYRKKYAPTKAKNDKYYGFTLESSDEVNFKIDNVDIYYGDLYNTVDTQTLRDLDKVHLVTSDAGFDQTKYSNQFYKEMTHLKVIYASIANALSVQAQGGHFFLKIFDVFSRPMLDLLHILRTFYSQVYITKLNTSAANNAERYIVCKYFKDDSNLQMKEFIQNMLDRIQDIPTPSPNNEIYITQILEDNPLLRDAQFMNAYKNYVNGFVQNQLDVGNEMIKIYESPDSEDLVNQYEIRQYNHSFKFIIDYDVVPIQRTDFSMPTAVETCNMINECIKNKTVDELQGCMSKNILKMLDERGYISADQCVKHHSEIYENMAVKGCGCMGDSVYLYISKKKSKSIYQVAISNDNVYVKTIWGAFPDKEILEKDIAAIFTIDNQPHSKAQALIKSKTAFLDMLLEFYQSEDDSIYKNLNIPKNLIEYDSESRMFRWVNNAQETIKSQIKNFYMNYELIFEKNEELEKLYQTTSRTELINYHVNNIYNFIESKYLPLLNMLIEYFTKYEILQPKWKGQKKQLEDGYIKVRELFESTLPITDYARKLKNALIPDGYTPYNDIIELLLTSDKSLISGKYYTPRIPFTVDPLATRLTQRETQKRREDAIKYVPEIRSKADSWYPIVKNISVHREQNNRYNKNVIKELSVKYETEYGQRDDVFKYGIDDDKTLNEIEILKELMVPKLISLHKTALLERHGVSSDNLENIPEIHIKNREYSDITRVSRNIFTHTSGAQVVLERISMENRSQIDYRIFLVRGPGKSIGKSNNAIFKDLIAGLYKTIHFADSIYATNQLKLRGETGGVVNSFNRLVNRRKTENDLNAYESGLDSRLVSNKPKTFVSTDLELIKTNYVGSVKHDGISCHIYIPPVTKDKKEKSIFKRSVLYVDVYLLIYPYTVIKIGTVLADKVRYPDTAYENYDFDLRRLNRDMLKKDLGLKTNATDKDILDSKDLEGTIIAAELVDNQIYCYDVAYYKGKNMKDAKFQERHNHLSDFMKDVAKYEIGHLHEKINIKAHLLEDYNYYEKGDIIYDYTSLSPDSISEYFYVNSSFVYLESDLTISNSTKIHNNPAIHNLLENNTIKPFDVSNPEHIKNSKYIKHQLYQLHQVKYFSNIGDLLTERAETEKEDGLIFTPTDKGYKAPETIIKWKPKEQLTVDVMYDSGKYYVAVVDKDTGSYNPRFDITATIIPDPDKPIQPTTKGVIEFLVSGVDDHRRVILTPVKLRPDKPVPNLKERYELVVDSFVDYTTENQLEISGKFDKRDGETPVVNTIPGVMDNRPVIVSILNEILEYGMEYVPEKNTPEYMWLLSYSNKSQDDFDKVLNKTIRLKNFYNKFVKEYLADPYYARQTLFKK